MVLGSLPGYMLKRIMAYMRMCFQAAVDGELTLKVRKRAEHNNLFDHLSGLWTRVSFFIVLISYSVLDAY